MRFPILVLLLAPLASSPVWAQHSHTVEETEPNDAPAQAKVTALGDTIVGTISSASDVDFFAVDVPAGMFVKIGAVQKVCVFDRDGVTPLACNNEDWPASFPFTTPGRYYIRVDGTAFHTGERLMGPYGLVARAESFPLAAGDPVRRIIDLPQPTNPYWSDQPWRVTAGLNGELYVGTTDRVLRVQPNGDTTTLAAGLSLGGDIAVDPFGDVIVADRAGCGSTAPQLWKISPTGTRSPFLLDMSSSTFCPSPALAVAPDGDLWVGTDAAITRFDPMGVKKAEVGLRHAAAIAVAPSGDLYVAGAAPCDYGIALVRGSTVECIIRDIASRIPAGTVPPHLELAIDEDGNLYVGQEMESWGAHAIDEFGHVDVFPSGSITPQRHALIPRLAGLIFGRDAQGNMTSRLFAIDWGSTPKLVELSGSAERAAGAGFNVRFFHATIDTLPLATMGMSYQQTLRISTDSTAHTWSLENGTLPPGLTLSTDGVVKGVPMAIGTYVFTVRATSGVRSWFAPGTMNVKGEYIEVSQIVAALLGGPALTPIQVQLLDQIGNKNGMLDAGDLRAYLRASGKLPSH